ncbi:MAG: FecR domain-containing protein [bacterium]|nr:FecR domain-containing protein [bacterium]
MLAQYTKPLFYAIVAAATVSAVTYCGPAKSKTRAAVVTYASPDTLILRGAEEIPARIGAVLKEKDVIQTGQGPMDLQTTTGSTVRVRPYTRLELTSLLTNQTVKLDLKNGTVSARVRRSAAGENFTVTTPTAIAGVRGTAFVVTEDPEKGAIVTVVEGAVAMSPRMKATAIPTPVPGKEIVIEASESAELVETRDSVEKSKVELTLRDQADFDSMIEVEDSLIEKAGALEQPTEAVVEEIKASYAKNRDAAFDRIADRANASDELKTGALIETLRLKDGGSYSGTIIAQAGDTLIIQGKQGVKRFKLDDVQAIDFGEE